LEDPNGRPAKRYYSISEVSEMLGEKAHVLRYWESQFPLLRPKKSRGGSRMYQDKDLDLLRSIQEMLHEKGYTIAGAKVRIGADHRRRLISVEPQMDLDFLTPRDRKQLRLIRSELVRLRDWLERRGQPQGAEAVLPPEPLEPESWTSEISIEPPLGEG
jgi:DNA-binding transcriptional MerR regulator